MKVYIGIPIHGGAGAEFISSLMKTRVILDRLGYDVEVDFHSGCSILPKARNEIVKRFFDSGFDCLFFIDSDMAWNPVDAVKLIRSGHDFSACVYRSKEEEENYHCVGGGTVGEWIKADSVATGFMCLSRNCIELMQAKHESTRYSELGTKYHALFDFEIHRGRYWGEDYTFCRRWREINGEINVLTDATISHIGVKSYTGNFAQHLKGLKHASVAI